MDVMENGRTLMIQDPTGAFLGCWQPNEQIGATRVNDPGCLTSNELSTNDIDRASEFYSGLFGWEFETQETGDAPPYWLIKHEGAARGLNGGARALSSEQKDAGAVPHWMPYFTAVSLDETLEKAKAGGATVHAGPIEIPAGRIAVISDPQGAFLGLFEGEVDD
jgi:predicted enzyme related to lactoylglutathione lyase